MKSRLSFTSLFLAVFLTAVPALASTTCYVDGVHGSDETKRGSSFHQPTPVSHRTACGKAKCSSTDEMSPGMTYGVLHTFKGPPDGAGPAGLVRDTAGNLYGTTQNGGKVNAYCSEGCGTVFKVDTAGKETVLHRFQGYPNDGAYPRAGVVRDRAGNLYGTAIYGGTSDMGVIFKVDPSGKETVLHSFTGSPDGEFPNAALLRDAAGNLYGTTQVGGFYEACGGLGCGVVFELDKNGTESVLYSFSGGSDGAEPLESLIRDSAGNLYGTASFGKYGYGVVFKLNKAGKQTVLHSFKGPPTDGEGASGLISDAAGNLYGATAGGGSFPGCGADWCGTVFKVYTNDNEDVLHNFGGSQDGWSPGAGVIRDAAGSLYGTTFRGGLPSVCRGLGCGVVFKLDITNTETLLYKFKGGHDGAGPGILIRDAAGSFYGITSAGGLSGGCGGGGCGVVFKLSPSANRFPVK